MKSNQLKLIGLCGALLCAGTALAAGPHSGPVGGGQVNYHFSGTRTQSNFGTVHTTPVVTHQNFGGHQNFGYRHDNDFRYYRHDRDDFFVPAAIGLGLVGAAILNDQYYEGNYYRMHQRCRVYDRSIGEYVIVRCRHHRDY